MTKFRLLLGTGAGAASRGAWDRAGGSMSCPGVFERPRQCCRGLGDASDGLECAAEGAMEATEGPMEAPETPGPGPS